MKNFLCIFGIASCFFALEVVAKPNTPHSAPTSKNYDFGKNVKPRYVRETTRPDGSRSVVYGNERSEKGKIGKPHGHGVQNPDGKLGYSRTIGGKVIKDDKKK